MARWRRSQRCRGRSGGCSGGREERRRRRKKRQRAAPAHEMYGVVTETLRGWKRKGPFLAGERAQRARVRRLGRRENLGSATRPIYVRWTRLATSFLQPRAYGNHLTFVPAGTAGSTLSRSEEHTSELQSRVDI